MKTLDDLKSATLGQVIDLYRRGEIDKATAEAYCNEWNTTFRFTEAKVVGDRIVHSNSISEAVADSCITEIVSQIELIRMIADAIADVVKDAGERGAPAGYLYAAVMSRVSLENFGHIMSALVAAGKVRKHGDCYFAM